MYSELMFIISLLTKFYHFQFEMRHNYSGLSEGLYNNGIILQFSTQELFPVFKS